MVIKVAWIACIGLAGGMGRVTVELLDNLHRLHPESELEMKVVGGRKLKGRDFPYEVIEQPNDEFDDYRQAHWGDWGIHAAIELKKRWDYDIIITFFDLEKQCIFSQKYCRMLKLAKMKRPRVVHYYFMDYENLKSPKLFPESYDFVSQVWALHSGSKKVIERVCWRPIEIVPHGINQTDFFPCHRDKVRQVWSTQLPLLDDGFLVLNANMNQSRKRMDLTIEGFARFAQNHSDAQLIMHCAGKSANIDLFDITDKCIEKYGLKKHQIIFTILSSRFEDLDTRSKHPAIDTYLLNYLYNCMNVGINTSMGEGWGLVACEMAMCEVPQLLPDFAASKYLFGDDSGFLIKAEERHTLDTGIMTCDGRIVDVQDIADKLEYIYTHPEEAKAKAQRAREKMLKLTWDFAAKMAWRALEKCIELEY